MKVFFVKGKLSDCENDQVCQTRLEYFVTEVSDATNIAVMLPT